MPAVSGFHTRPSVQKVPLFSKIDPMARFSNGPSSEAGPTHTKTALASRRDVMFIAAGLSKDPSPVRAACSREAVTEEHAQIVEEKSKK